MDKKGLIDEIKNEIENLKRLNEEMKALLKDIKEQTTFKEIRVGASILHDFYSGIEKIFKRIALVIDNHLPKAEEWHIKLLFQMANPFDSIRSSVISKELFEKLKEYLKFRHLFRHIYGFELKWDKIENLCLEMSKVLNRFIKEIDKFLKTIEGK
jgi:hypothetical protein